MYILFTILTILLNSYNETDYYHTYNTGYDTVYYNGEMVYHEPCLGENKCVLDIGEEVLEYIK